MDKKSKIISRIPHKFKIKIVGKSYVGKTSFIKSINNNQYSLSHKKLDIPINYKLNFHHKYKDDIFFFEEEPEIDADYFPDIGISPPFYTKPTNTSIDYVALLFMFDVSDKESFDYIEKSLKTTYSNSCYLNIMKIIVSNKNDLDEKLKQVKTEDIQRLIKIYNLHFFKISCRDTKQVNDLIYKIYDKMKEIVKFNEYYNGIENCINIDKENLIPNYYEICILGDSNSGKDSLKNKILYDCCEKSVDLYEYCIPRTLNISGKEIKFDIYVKREEKDAHFQDINLEFYYKTINNLDPNCNCILLTYDISNNASFENLKKIVNELLYYSIRYKKVFSILGMKCDLLQENELNKKIKDGKNLASLINAHYYLVSNTTGFNVDTVFNDILVQAYNTYHLNSNDYIPTKNYYKETIDDSIYSSIHIRNEKPKMKEKDKKKIEKQIEKELNNIKKLKTQKLMILANKQKKETDAYSSQIKETLKLNYSKIFRCIKCWKIPKLQISELNNTIKTNCIHNGKKIMQNYKIDEYLGIKSTINDVTLCSFCKGNNSNHPYSFDYCFNCQRIFCKKCESNHNNSIECKDIIKSSEEKNERLVVPIYLMDSYCYTHDTRSKYFCVDCQKYICEKCFGSKHSKHLLKYYRKEYVNELINDKKQLIEREKVCYKFVQTCFNDCIKSLQNKFNELMDLKMKKLNIKESLIKDLELFKNNYTLIENVANLRFEDLKFLKFNIFESWKNKLNIIFDYLDEPLYIKNTNVCLKQNIGKPFNILNEIKKQNKENKKKEAEEAEKEKEKEIEKEKRIEKEKENDKNKEKEKDKEKENKKEKDKDKEKQNSLIENEDIDTNLKIEQMMFNDQNNSLSYECNIEGNPDDILITDICALSSKYFGISSDDGLLKIYNSYHYREKPINTIKEYLPNKGIFSLYKPNKGLHLNYNFLYLIGYETIKRLVFNNEYTEYIVNEVYTIKDCFYINIIELLNIKGILISTLKQEILSVVNDDKKRLIKTDLTYMINDVKAGKEIVSINEIGANKFNLKLTDVASGEEDDNEQETINKEKQMLRKRTIGNKLRKNENNNFEENIKIHKKNIYNVLIELEHEEKTDNILLKNKYVLYKNYDILGKMNSNQLFVVDKNIENLPTITYLFDFNTNTFIKRFYLPQSIPILFHKLENWLQNDAMFLLLDNKMNLTQYLFENERVKEMKPLFSIDLKEIIIKKNKDDNIILLNVGDKIFLFANNGLIFRINN